MKNTIITLLLVVTSSLSFGQLTKEYTKITYLIPNDIVEKEYTISVKNIVSTKEYCKLAVTVTNKTDAILLFVPQEGSFNFEFGSRKSDTKDFYIMPHDSKTKTLTVNGGNEFLQEKFSAKLGLLIKIPTDKEVIETPNFILPATKNSFSTGDFNVVLKKYNASTKEAKAVFECTYTGNDIAVVNPSHLSVSAVRKGTDETVIYANDNKRSKPTPLKNGQKVKITAIFHIQGRIVDMQFATMEIIWNNTFIVTQPSLYLLPVINFELDKSLSN